MAFARIQGSKVVVLHSRRAGPTVRQQKVHEFHTPEAARKAVESDREWNLLCESFQLALGKARLDRDALRSSLRRLLERISVGGGDQPEPRNPIEALCAPIVELLQTVGTTPSPEQYHWLRGARMALERVRDLVGEKLRLLGKNEPSIPIVEDQSEKEKSEMSGHPTPDASNRNVQDLLEYGTTLFERGEWHESLEALQDGLSLAPNHPVLLLYAGYCHAVTGSHELAVEYYSRVMDIVQPQIDRALREESDDYMRIADFEARLQSLECQVPDEHIVDEDGQCEECRETFRGMRPTLDSHTEFRPFFQALSTKARSLMLLRRYREAIQTLKLGMAYERLNGNFNQLGECYLRLGDAREAERWYCELLWPSAYYVRSLILERLGRRDEALALILKATFRNVHMARMLLGRERKERIRWCGVGLPPRLEASEFMYEEGDLFRGASGFKALLRAVCDDPEISRLHCELVDAVERRRRERDYTVPKLLWRLYTGVKTEDFIKEHSQRLLGRLQNPRHASWFPSPQDIIRVRILEQKRVNWRVNLLDHDRELYFRPGGPDADLEPGDAVEIRVAKAWLYRRSLFVAGECLRRIDQDR